VDVEAQMGALSQSCLLEAKSENGVLKNQPLAQINFPVFGDLRQSPCENRLREAADAQQIA
jgi:hypothetical protein